MIMDHYFVLEQSYFNILVKVMDHLPTLDHFLHYCIQFKETLLLLLWTTCLA